MNRYLKLALLGGTFGLAAISSTALAIVFTGRDTAQQRTISQVGLRAVTPELGITATPSGTQVTSYQLTAGVSQVTTSTVGPDGVKLPSLTSFFGTTPDASLNVVIMNNTANSINIFPFAATDVIVSAGTAAGAGAALSLTTLKSASCWSVSTGRWYCVAG